MPGALKRDVTVSFVFEPNGTDHDDLVLRVGGWEHRSDSYYYALDDRVGPPRDTVAAIRGLLAQWTIRVRAAEGIFYLPYDFSDQCTGWLRGCVEGESISLVPGWSNREGYSFHPSDHLEVAGELSDFAPLDDVAPCVISREALLLDIEESSRSIVGPPL